MVNCFITLEKYFQIGESLDAKKHETVLSHRAQDGMNQTQQRRR